MKRQQKLYIVEKFIWARDINDALKKEKSIHPNNIYVDNEWRKNSMEYE